jgi:hypothetical protein
MARREYGHIRKPLRGRWQAIEYRGGRDVKIGEYDTREEAVAALQSRIAEIRAAGGKGINLGR